MADRPVAVLVEGESDREAVLALAQRRATDLSGADLVAMGGITNIARYVAALAPTYRLVGLTTLARSGSYARASSAPGSRRPPTSRTRGSTAATATWRRS